MRPVFIQLRTMSIPITQAALAILALYLVLGIVVGLFLGIAGLKRIDHAAKGAPIGFRVVIFPALVALWPFMLMKWIRAGKGACYPNPEKPVGFLALLAAQRWGFVLLVLVVAPLGVLAWIFRIGS